MSIQEVWGKFKDSALVGDLVLALIIAGTAMAGFWLGRYSVHIPSEPVLDGLPQEASVLRATGRAEAPLDEEDVDAPAEEAQDQAYVASKTGTKYHLPTCAGAKQINEENKLWFSTKEEAEAAGYTPATNCKGI